MSQELNTEISSEIINSLVLTGDMSKLTPAQQTQYYGAVCKSVGINPITQPFAIMVLNGKKILYATKGCTQQLSDTRSINTEIKDRKTIDSVYVVSVRATMKDGRFTDEDGIVSIVGLKGAELANAMMKAVTKAKRRAVLALCGLGIPDETEIEDTPHAAAQPDNGKSRLENIVDAQHEVKEDGKPQEDSKVSNASNVSKPKETGKGKKKDSEPEPVKVDNDKLPEGHKIIIGLIANSAEGANDCYKTATVDKDGKPTLKHSFLIDGKRYGTFDAKMANHIVECMDKRIMVKIEYKERNTGKAILNDIISFKQAVAGVDVPIED